MNVAKLKERIEGYKAYLRNDRDLEWIHIWESANNFKLKWEIAAPKFAEMYASAFRNDTTQRLWKRENWTPLEIMNQLSSDREGEVRELFQELFDEVFAPNSRIVHFKKGLDNLLVDYKKEHWTWAENNHYHSDNEMIFLYLGFRFPEQFTLWNFPAFYQMMMSLDVREEPIPYDLDRFIKATNIWNAFLDKDPEIETLIKKRLRPALHYLAGNRIKVFEFYMICTGTRL